MLLFDPGHSRNEPSSGVHGYFTRDCIRPAELLRIGREQLEPYGVEFRHATVTEVAPAPDGEELQSRKC